MIENENLLILQYLAYIAKGPKEIDRFGNF
jgi:hypothetical protein